MMATTSSSPTSSSSATMTVAAAIMSSSSSSTSSSSMTTFSTASTIGARDTTLSIKSTASSRASRTSRSPRRAPPLLAPLANASAAATLRANSSSGLNMRASPPSTGSNLYLPRISFIVTPLNNSIFKSNNASSYSRCLHASVVSLGIPASSQRTYARISTTSGGTRMASSTSLGTNGVAIIVLVLVFGVIGVMDDMESSPTIARRG
mmetsp:Transcript_6694/g.24379  ORF Transcript_6694/g.24379 Transcript_6694/m.24379 type:complete len:207 (-) Transcript_6694:342-962(-)